MKTLSTGKNRIGREEPCYVIAEIGHNHQGNLEMALQMVEEAAKCGVSAVKFQKRDIDSLYTREFLNKPYTGQNSFGATYGEHRQVLEFGMEEMLACRSKAKELGLDFIVTPFDFPSLEFCTQIGVDCFKIASGDLTNHPLIKAIVDQCQPIIISCGAATLHETQETHQMLRGLDAQFVMLYAISNYPADHDQLNMKRIMDLQQCFPETLIGYSGHDIGIEATLMARTLGAVVIEKHFTLDQQLKGTDQSFSLNPSEMAQLVKGLKKVDAIMGEAYLNANMLNSYELPARKKLGKGIYAKFQIESGMVLEREMLEIKSPGNEMPPNQLASILGKQANQIIPKGSPLTPQYFD